MNDDSDRSAWVWYDRNTLAVKHVGFDMEAEHGANEDNLEIAVDLAVDLVTGVKLLSDFMVTKIKDEYCLVERSMVPPIPRFWKLIDLDQPQSTTSFAATDAEAIAIRVRSRDSESFMVDVLGTVRNVRFYITMRNDPNYLLKTVDLLPQDYKNGISTGIRIYVNLGHDYSVYVRYDAP
jgi:hypothetical protein